MKFQVANFTILLFDGPLVSRERKLSWQQVATSLLCMTFSHEIVENLEFSENSDNQFYEVFHSGFSIWHYTQSRKLRVENLIVFSQAL